LSFGGEGESSESDEGGKRKSESHGDLLVSKRTLSAIDSVRYLIENEPV